MPTELPVNENEDNADINDDQGDNGDDEEDEPYFTKEERLETAEIYKKSCWNNVFRSKGMIYLSSQTNQIFTWQTSGIVNETRHLGMWLATGTKEQIIEKGGKEDYDSWGDKLQGDRKTELVIIGSGIDKKALTKCLDDCLVSEAEYEKMKTCDEITSKDVPEGFDDPYRPIEKGEDDDEKDWEDEDEKENAEAA